MTNALNIPGASVVGRLTDMSPREAELILSMRLWMDDPDGQAEVWNGVARSFVAAEARGVLAGATMIASLLLPTRHAELVARSAAQVGQAMQRMTRKAPSLQSTRYDSEHRVLH